MASMSVPRWSVYVVITALIASLSFSIGAVYTARGDNHDTEYWACLFAGSLSQVGTTEPANCGRGQKISWNSEGVQGAPGVSGLTTVSTIFVTSDATRRTQYMSCPEGLIPVGSGYQQAGLTDTVLVFSDFAITTLPFDDPFGFTIEPDAPLTSDYGWVFQHHTLDETAVIVRFQVYCAEVEPSVT